MSDRQNTLVCAFDMKSPRISAFQIHEWIYEKLKLPEEDLSMIQIDGPKRHVYIKFKNTDLMQQVLTDTKGQEEFKHGNGELSKVNIEPAGMGMRRIRIANLPPEVNERTIRNMLLRYGDVKEITEETWSRNYRYKINNGIRIATIQLEEHIPSHMVIADNRALISYEGQPPTCYSCNNTGHHFQDCPKRKHTETRHTKPITTSWTDIIQQRKTNEQPVESRTQDILIQDDEKEDSESIMRPSPSKEVCQREKEMEATHDIGHRKTQEEEKMQTELETGKSTRMGKDNDEPTDKTRDKRERNGGTLTQTSVPHEANIETDVEMEEDTLIGKRQKHKDAKEREATPPPPTTDEEVTQYNTPISPKRMKKLRVEREMAMSRDRTRSTERQRKSQRL